MHAEKEFKNNSTLSETFPTQSAASSKENLSHVENNFLWSKTLKEHQAKLLNWIESFSQKHNVNAGKKKSNEITPDVNGDVLPAYEVKHSAVFGRWLTFVERDLMCYHITWNFFRSGRYLVAARDLSTCEIIIQQLPLVIGPIANDENAPVCLNCYQAVEIDSSFRYEHDSSQYLNMLYDYSSS